jgi:hypothetical protein
VSAYVYGGLAGAILVLAGLLWLESHHLDRAKAEFTAYKAAQAQAVADAGREAADKAKETERFNATIMADLQNRLDGSVTNGERLAARLRLALAGIHTSPLPEAPGQPGTAPTSGAEVVARAAQLVGDVTAECERNADRLDAWIAEMKPQL